MCPTDPTLVRALLEAYRSGHFPMADPDTGEVGWYGADPRAILPLEPGGFHLSRSLRKRLNSGKFAVTTDAAFSQVTRECGEPGPGRDVSWINDEIRVYYDLLHHAGHAHSIEAWIPDSAGNERAVLVGGIYGVCVGTAFFAESMFSRPALGGTDASKVCLACLVAHLRLRGYSLLDVQLANSHTSRFGVVEISRRRFISRLQAAAKAPQPTCLPFDPQLTTTVLAAHPKA